MPKNIGNPTTLNVTPIRGMTWFNVSKPVGSADIEITATFADLNVDENGSPLNVIREFAITKTGAELVATGLIDSTRFQALYTEISETMHALAVQNA